MIEVTIFFAIVLALSSMVASIYEWWQDVPHGPYLKHDDHFDNC